MNPFKTIGGMLAVCCALLFSHVAVAVEVTSVKLDDIVKVGNQDLKLNGAGIRSKVIFKVYVVGLYLSEKKSAVADVMTVSGARRISIGMLRDVGSEEFAKAFASGIEQNTDTGERAAITASMTKFNAMFAAIPELKQGDVLYLDWLPGSGMVVFLNGKKILEPINDLAFYNAVLRIWLGEKPVDDKLKKQLLGAQ